MNAPLPPIRETNAERLLALGLPRHALERLKPTSPEGIVALARSGKADLAVENGRRLASSWKRALIAPKRRRQMALALAPYDTSLAFDLLPALARNTPLARALALKTGQIKPLPKGTSSDPLVEILHALQRQDTNAARQMWAEVFLENGLEPLDNGVRPDGTIAFDTLSAVAPKGSVEGPKVSVIVTAFEAERTLETALRSLAASTWRDLEIVVVDDCSTDETSAVARHVLEGSQRAHRVLRLERNVGTYSARNEGARAAGGSYILCLDADDWAHPRLIERQYSNLKKVGAAIVSSNGIRVNEVSGAPVSARVWPLSRWNPSSTMFARDIFQKVGFWREERYGADLEFVARIERLCGPQVRLKESLALLRDRPDSLTHSHAGLDCHGFSQARLEQLERWRSDHDSGIFDPEMPTATGVAP